MIHRKILFLLGVVQAFQFSEEYFIRPLESDEGFTVAVAGTDLQQTSPVPRHSLEDKVKLRNKPKIISILRDSMFDDKYKPWGAASLPTSAQNPPNAVILDKVDEDLFAPSSERHEYDQREHQDTRMKVLYS